MYLKYREKRIKMLFDTHAHYDDERFEQDRYEIIEEAHNNGISYILNASCNIATAIESIALSQKYEYIYAAVGIHPHNVDEANKNTIPALMDFAEKKKVVAIGEIGLDYYYDISPKELQKKWFAAQIEMAKAIKKPIIVHDRDSHEDIIKIIKEENAKEIGGVLHCFSGSVEMAKEVLKNNFYISLGGPVTFKNARKTVEVAKYVPLERILIETDSPYLTPEPFRGKRNNSKFVKYIAQKIAEIKGISFEEVAQETTRNAKELFGIEG